MRDFHVVCVCVCVCVWHTGVLVLEKAQETEGYTESSVYIVTCKCVKDNVLSSIIGCSKEA